MYKYNPSNPSYSYKYKHETEENIKYEGKFFNKLLGEMVEGCPHGKGVLVYSIGDIYTGEFKLGKIEGWGKVELHNGDVYDGQWK